MLVLIEKLIGRFTWESPSSYPNFGDIQELDGLIVILDISKNCEKILDLVSIAKIVVHILGGEN